MKQGECVFLNRLRWLYCLISRHTCAREYPLTFSAYRRITPFSVLLSREYVNLTSTASIHRYRSSIDVPPKSNASLHSKNCLTCSIVWSFSSFMISCVPIINEMPVSPGSSCIGRDCLRSSASNANIPESCLPQLRHSA